MNDKTSPMNIDKAIRVMNLMKKTVKIYPRLRMCKIPEQLIALSQAIDLSIEALKKQKEAK